MLKKSITALSIAILFSLNLFGQSNSTAQNAQQQQQFSILQPELHVSDIYLALNILEDVTLKGSEVEAFLEVTKQLNAYLDYAKKEELKASEKIRVNMHGRIAQNTLTFLNRATIKGKMANQYKRFTDAIENAPKAEKQK